MDVPEEIVFNGLDGSTGGYLLAATAERIAEVAQDEQVQASHLRDLAARLRDAEPNLGVVGTVTDPSDLAQTGWGVVFAADSDPAIREALSELLAWRREQATRQRSEYYREYSGPSGYHPGETVQEFLVHRGATPSGSADPDQMPYYLLIVAPPHEIPFSFEYGIRVQRAVGRIYFDTPAEYAQYARSVVMAERSNPRPRRAVFFGVEHDDDWATRLSTERLVEPLVQDAERWQRDVPPGRSIWEIQTHLREHASKGRLHRLLGGGETPALLFTASHGVGFPNGHPLQRRHQGALVCQEWSGPRGWEPRPIENCYFSADDIGEDGRLLGLIAFHFACYGVGTPGEDDYPQLVNGRISPSGPLGTSPSLPIAPRSFISRLPQRLLGHPKGGALAVVGHVERALGSSFVEQPSGAAVSPTTFRSFLRRTMLGERLGAAIEPFHERYAELCAALAEEIRQIHSYGKAPKPHDLARMWMGTADARGYAIFGDPAVRLVTDDGPSQENAHMTIENVTARTIDERDSVSQSAAPTPAVASDGVAPGPSQPAPNERSATTDGPSLRRQVSSPPSVRLEIDSATGRISVTTQPTAAPPANAVPPADQVTYGWPFSEGPSSFAEIQEKIAGSLKDAAEGLGTALKNLVADVSTLQVTTYICDDLDAVSYDAGSHTFVGPVGRHMQTCIRLDGDTVMLVPSDTSADDPTLWKMHTDAVARAQAHRAELIKAVSEAVVGLMGGLRASP